MKIPNQPYLKSFMTISLVSLLLGGSLTASPGSSAANFLKIGVGSRGAAMGEAQTAITQDVNSAYWNPAGLTHMRFKEVSFMHYSLVDGVRYQNAAFGMPTQNRGHIAFSLSRLDYGNIAGYDDNSLPTGQVDASNLLFTGSWAKLISQEKNLSFGANLKYLKSDLAGYSASVPMVDLGLQMPFKVKKLEGLSVAATLRHLGPKIKYDSEASSLPQQFVLGAGLNALGGNLNLAADFIKPNDNSAYLAFGLEYRLLKMLNLRVGYNGLQDFVGNAITYGMGLEFQNWQIDYAFVPYGDLGDTNRVTVGVRFGHARQLKSAEDQVELAYNSAQRQLALGNGVKAYSTVIDLLLIAPWHKPSVELKAKIEKQFSEMENSKEKVRVDTQIADAFTSAKSSFDRDELVDAKKGFETILALQPGHVGSKVYLERIQNRYASLAQESFKQGMDFFAAGNYEDAILMFEKTISIDEYHVDARAQLERARELKGDRQKRIEEINRLAGAADAYKEGLKYYQEGKWENALAKFEEVQTKVPEYEEVGRYYKLTIKTLSGVLFQEATVNIENGKINEAVEKLRRADALTPNDERIQSALKVAERDQIATDARESKRLYQDGLEAYLEGNSDKAEKLWNQALELDSTNDDALKAITKLQEQKAYDAKKD